MKRSWLLLLSNSSRQQPSHKPWRILHRHTCHPSLPAVLPPSPIQSRSVTCTPSPTDTWSYWPSSPSLSRHGTWQVLPKLMHPFNGSMFPPPLLQSPHALQNNTPQALEKKHDPFNTSPNASIHMPSICFQKSATNHAIKDINAHVQLRQMRRLLRVAQLDALKQRLERETHDVMTYNELLNLCSSLGVASSPKRATLLVKHLDDAGFIFIFQDTVYLKPNKIAQLLKEVMPQPFAIIKEREHILQEMSRLEQEKDEIDKLAHNHSRKVLWLGFSYLVLQMALIFHLTFWELSWDVMEPIAYFVTNITLLLGYVFFMITSKHPTYQDLNTFLISSKQRKLMKARNFDVTRLLELQKQHGSSTPSFLSRTTKGY